MYSLLYKLYFYLKRLFGTQSHNGVLLCRDAGGDQACDERQEHTDANQDDRAANGQGRLQIGNARQGVQNDIDNYDKSQRHQNTDGTGYKTYNNRLRIKHAGNILFRSTNGAQNTDFLCSFKN